MEDLGHLLPPNPITPSSMCAANTISDDGTGFAGPGSPSEVVDEADIGQVPSLADMMTDHGPAGTLNMGDEPAPASVWTDVSSRPWAQAADAQSPGGAQAPRDSGGRWRQT